MSNKKKLRALRYRYLSLLCLPEFPREFITFKTFAGLEIAKGYIRVVIGERGPYVEFDRYQIVQSALGIPSGEEWRKVHNAAYYVEYRSTCTANIMVYYQRRLVDYADYRLGYLYIDPYDLICDQYKPIINRKQWRLFNHEHR